MSELEKLLSILQEVNAPTDILVDVQLRLEATQIQMRIAELTALKTDPEQLTVLKGSSLAKYPTNLPTLPPEIQTEVDICKQNKRSEAYTRLKAEFGAYNTARVRKGEFSASVMTAWISSTECEKVFGLLRSNLFEAAISRIALMVGLPATKEFKDMWTAKLEAEL